MPELMLDVLILDQQYLIDQLRGTLKRLETLQKAVAGGKADARYAFISTQSKVMNALHQQHLDLGKRLNVGSAMVDDLMRGWKG